jgi:Polyketide cyclase / dehydrase and lipid transport
MSLPADAGAAGGLSYAESVLIARPAGELYDLISDVTRMGEWSPVCRACWWDDGAGPRVGAMVSGSGIRWGYAFALTRRRGRGAPVRA